MEMILAIATFFAGFMAFQYGVQVKYLENQLRQRPTGTYTPAQMWVGIDYKKQLTLSLDRKLAAQAAGAMGTVRTLEQYLQELTQETPVEHN
jgi:hypothetical protein